MRLIAHLLIGIVAVVIVRPQLLWACEPCRETFDFQQTVQHSDAIIIGQKIEEGPQTEPRFPSSPDWIKVKVLRGLRGGVIDPEIKVNSWDGMCPYGIVVDDKTYVMLLKAKADSPEGYQYDAVNYGCGVKTYLLENDQIAFEGRKISLADFIAMIPGGPQ